MRYKLKSIPEVIFNSTPHHLGASLLAQLVKKSAYNVGDLVLSLGQEDPLEKVKATLSSILAWRILWTVVHVVAKSQT